MANIRLGTAANIRAFQTLSTSLSSSDSEFTHLIDRDALEDEFGRFRVWSGNLGALQKGHSALDYRLRDSPLLSSNALKLLKELEENITEAIAIVTGTRLPYEQQPKSEEKDDEDVDDDFYSEDEDEDSETGAPKTELEQRFREIVDIVDNLYKLSVRIRTPTIRSRSLKASSYRPKDPETGVDILDQYAAFDLQHTRELVRHERLQHTKEIKDDDPIIENLSKAITLRRRQFMYWRRHRDKLGVSTVPEEEQRAAQPVGERFDAPDRHDTFGAQAGNPIVTALKIAAASEKTGKTMLSGTEATRHHQSLDEIVDSRSVTSYATTVRDLTGKGIDLPPPPKAANGDKDFECPYCFIICPARYGKGRAWKTHVLQDLQPYICTYPDCESSEQLFRSRREWSDHESSHRKAWRCPEHPNAVYRSRSGLEDHLRRKHSDSFPEAQLGTIINVGETSTVDTREKCPVCFVKVNTEGGFSLQNHVANHLERLASFALPRNVNNDEDGASSIASRGRSASSGSQGLSDISFNSYISEEGEPGLRRAMGNSESTLLFSEQEETSSGDIAAPSGQGLLSAELLGHLPDSSQTSQERLGFLFPTKDLAEDDFDERLFDDEPEEAVEHLAEVQTFRVYLLSLPSAESVRFLRRFGWWRGYTNFRDQRSAQEAMHLFDKARFPDVKITQGVENKAALKFSFPAWEKAEKGLSQPNDKNEDASSSSTQPILYSEGKSKIPLLHVAEIPTLHALYRTGELLQRDQSYASNDTFNQIVSFCYYDITRLKVDAIVNSANKEMKVTKVPNILNDHIHKHAGPGLQRECKAAGKIETGQVRLTSGYDLPATYIIHAARPRYSTSKKINNINILTECYRSSLKTAMNHGIKTIAFPCLAAGGCGFPPGVAARAALEEVRVFLDTHKVYAFERIIFCVYSSLDQKAYKKFLPVFFPPTHSDLENVTPFEPFQDWVSRAIQLQEASVQLSAVSRDLLNFSEHIPDFPQDVFRELHDIVAAFDSLHSLFFESKETIQNLNNTTITDVDLICSVMQSFSGGVLELTEQGKADISRHEAMWQDYNFHMKSSNDMDILGLLELCLNFIQSLDDILSYDGIEPYEMATMRVRLGSYRMKVTGEGHKGVRDHFDEVMYTREYQQSNTPSHRTDILKLHQIPSIARLYQLGDLEYKPTNAIPSENFNHTLYLLRDDITRVESDVIVNSTDPKFSSMGTLDRTVFKKGGPAMQQACSELGLCNEGDVKVTPGFLLPAKHVIHAVPPGTYRSNTKDVLRKLYREILYTAQSLKATSIAIPAIGTGMLNYPRRDCALLALEEVKRFLESAEPASSIEKIIFCVFGSNDEFIYKSFLPVYFPPIDLNPDNALPASISIPSSSLKPNTAETPDEQPGPPPKRSLFGSVGDAFRNVRFGKQRVTERSRILNPAEQHALTNFEDHCHICNTCNNIAKLYAEGKELCPDGYAMAQLILQYLYMEQDRSVYSTNQEGGYRVKVEVPERYKHSWNLLVTVEMSHRYGENGRAFVSPDQPYVRGGEREEEEEGIPPGVTIHNATITVPVKEEPKMFTALVFRRSSDKATWVPLSADECIIYVPSRGFEVYETEQQMRAKFPLWNLNLATAWIQENSDTELTIDPKGNGDVLLIRSGDPTKHDLLFEALEREANERQLVRLNKSDDRMIEPAVVAPSVSEPQKFKAFLLRWSGVTEGWVPLHPEESILHIYPGKAELYATDDQQQPPLMHLDLTSLRFSKDSDLNIKIDRKGWKEPIMLRSQSLTARDILLTRLKGENKDESADAASSDNASPDNEAPLRPDYEKAMAFIFTWSDQEETWQPIRPDECSIHIHFGKAEVYASDQRTGVRLPLLYLDLTPSTFLEISYSDLVVNKAWKEKVMLRCRGPTECEMLYRSLQKARKDDSKYLQALGVQDSTREFPEDARAFPLRWSKVDQTWFSVGAKELDVYIRPTKIELYETGLEGQAQIPTLSLDLTDRGVVETSDADLILNDQDEDKRWMLRCRSHNVCSKLVEKIKLSYMERSKVPQLDLLTSPVQEQGTDTETTTPPRSEPLDSFVVTWILAWSQEHRRWENLHQSGECVVNFYAGNKTEIYRASRQKNSRVPLLYLDLTPEVSVHRIADSSTNSVPFVEGGTRSNLDLRIEKACKRDLLLRCRNEEEREMLYQRLEQGRKAGQKDVLSQPGLLHHADDSLESIPGPIRLRAGYITTFKVPKIQKWSEERQSWENLHQQNECTIHFFPNEAEIYETNHLTQTPVPLLRLNLTPSVLVINLPGTNTNMTIEKACKKKLKVACESKEQRQRLYKTLRHVMNGESPRDLLSSHQGGIEQGGQTMLDDPLYQAKAGETIRAGLSDQEEAMPKSRTQETPLTHKPVSALGLDLSAQEEWEKLINYDEELYDPLFQGDASFTGADSGDNLTFHNSFSDSIEPYNPYHNFSLTTSPVPSSVLAQRTNSLRLFASTSSDSYSVLNLLAKRVLAYLKITSAMSDVREDRIAADLGADPENVARALRDLKTMGLVFTTVEEHTWCASHGEIDPALQEQRPQEEVVPKIYVEDVDEEERAIAESVEMSLPASEGAEGVTDQPVDVQQHDEPLEARAEHPINLAPSMDTEAIEASTQDKVTGEEQQGITPTPTPLDLSTSLSSLNIDDFFTYLDLATSFSSAVTSGTPAGEDPKDSALKRTLSLPVTPGHNTTAHDPTSIPYYEVDPSQPISQPFDDTIPQVSHPRPGTPDLEQNVPIPPGARWTKIDRKLVNPQALDLAKERYEEREDSVVVLRVLTRAEVLQLAERTREIRRGRAEPGESLFLDLSKYDVRNEDSGSPRAPRDGG
jgi:O-acetyl-ADP-ribose deacetylase (regulator of RNase III)